jgi:hypothetical protein
MSRHVAAPCCRSGGGRHPLLRQSRDRVMLIACDRLRGRASQGDERCSSLGTLRLAGLARFLAGCGASGTRALAGG